MKNLTRTTFLLCTILICASAAFSQDTAKMKRLIKEGVALNDSGKYNEAIEKYKAALQINPKNMQAQFEMSYTLTASGRPDEAIHILEKFNAGDAYPEAYDLLGSIYDDKKDYEKAVAAYNLGITAFPNYQRLRFNLGISLLRQGKYADAEASAIQAIELNPKHASSHRLYALAMYKQNKNVPAVMAFCTFLMLEPQTQRSTEAYQYLRKILDSRIKIDSVKNGVTKSMTIYVQDHKGADSSMMGLEALLSMAVATANENSDKHKALSGVDVLNEELNGTFNMVGELAEKNKDDTFFWRFYVAYFDKLSKSGNMPAFTRLISLSGYRDDNIKWFKDNPDKRQALKDWVGKTNFDTGRK